MKYVITDESQARVGSDFVYHRQLADGLAGRVIGAGYCQRLEDGTYEVYGESIGYRISARPEDAKALQEIVG